MIWMQLGKGEASLTAPKTHPLVLSWVIIHSPDLLAWRTFRCRSLRTVTTLLIIYLLPIVNWAGLHLKGSIFFPKYCSTTVLNLSMPHSSTRYLSRACFLSSRLP